MARDRFRNISLEVTPRIDNPLTSCPTHMSLPQITSISPETMIASKSPELALELLRRAKWNRNTLNFHRVGQPEIQRCAAGDGFAIETDFHCLSQLAKSNIVIMDKNSWTFIPCGISNLLLQPIQGWMHGGIHVNDLPAFQFHDDKDVDRNKEERELCAKIERPDDGGIILEKGAPLLCSP